MEPPWDGGTKVCSNGPGHITKMSAMPIYGKKILKNGAFDPILFILAGNEGMHKLSDGFELRPDRTIDYGVSCP